MGNRSNTDGRGGEFIEDDESAENERLETLFCRLPDGAGCVEIWNHLGETRDDE